MVLGLLIKALLQIHPSEEELCKFKGFASLKERKVPFFIGDELTELAAMGLCGADLLQQVYKEIR